jgi:hypothetical protein
MVTRVPLRRAVSRERLTPPPGSRMRRRALATAVSASAVLLVFVASAGAGVLDQSQPGLRTNFATFVSDSHQRAQTFTTGLTGALDQVDVAVGRVDSVVTASLLVEIRPLSSGVPSGPALASASLPAASIPVAPFPSGFLSVPLAPPAPVTAGIQYAIVLSSSSCGAGDFFTCYRWTLGPAGDSYPGGSGLRSLNGGATWTPFTDFGSTDLPFKTYVLQAPTSKQQCKKGGWKQFRNPSFRNQGQCVKYVNHHGGQSGKGKYDDSSQGKKKTGKKK